MIFLWTENSQRNLIKTPQKKKQRELVAHKAVSVLGLILFNLYISDMKIPRPGNLGLNADDVAI